MQAFDVSAGAGEGRSAGIFLGEDQLDHQDDARALTDAQQEVLLRVAPYGYRAVPVDFELVGALPKARRDSEWPSERDLVFASERGTPLDYKNLHKRAFKPAAGEAGVPWAGFHTFRRTCATRLFAQGRNAVQVQRWLGHRSPAFTLSVYVQLMNDDLGGPLALSVACMPEDAATAPDLEIAA